MHKSVEPGGSERIKQQNTIDLPVFSSKDSNIKLGLAPLSYPLKSASSLSRSSPRHFPSNNLDDDNPEHQNRESVNEALSFDNINPSWRKWEHAYATETGYAPFQTKINQDTFIIQPNVTVSTDLCLGIYGVFDGHGESGHDVARFVSKNFVTALLRQKEDLISGNFRRALTCAVKRLSNSLKRSSMRTAYSGTTATVVLRVSDDNIFVMNVGDSRAVMGRNIHGNESWLSIPLSFDHKPENIAEKLRIESKGGSVHPLKGPPGVDCGPDRVWIKNGNAPGLAMSRSIGDDVAHSVGVSDDPDILEYNVQKSDKFIIIATDGVWEFIGSEESTKCIGKLLSVGISEATRKLVRKSQKRWRKVCLNR